MICQKMPFRCSTRERSLIEDPLLLVLLQRVARLRSAWILVLIFFFGAGASRSPFPNVTGEARVAVALPPARACGHSEDRDDNNKTI